MILRDGTNTREWSQTSTRYLDRMALVLDRIATLDSEPPAVSECWIVEHTFVEFIGRRVLYSEATAMGLAYWSRRYRDRDEAKAAAAEVLGCTLDEMIVR